MHEYHLNSRIYGGFYVSRSSRIKHCLTSLLRCARRDSRATKGAACGCRYPRDSRIIAGDPLSLVHFLRLSASNLNLYASGRWNWIGEGEDFACRVMRGILTEAKSARITTKLNDNRARHRRDSTVADDEHAPYLLLVYSTVLYTHRLFEHDPAPMRDSESIHDDIHDPCRIIMSC